MDTVVQILETERLFLREITVNDAETAYLLNLDTDVIKYTGDKSFDSIESARQFLTSYDHYKKYGFGRWAVIRKQDSEFLDGVVLNTPLTQTSMTLVSDFLNSIGTKVLQQNQRELV